MASPTAPLPPDAAEPDKPEKPEKPEKPAGTSGHGEPDRQPEPALFDHRRILQIVAALVTCLFVAALSHTVVATALPTMVGELGGQDQLAWVASATLLATTVTTPMWGKLSDIYGRKPLMQAALGIFVLTSIVAGLAQTMPQLIAGRAGQGIGTGGIIALANAILGDIVSPRERGRYAGYLGASFGIATVAGPLIGGFLVDGPGWRWCFYVGVPVGVVAAVVLQKTLHLRVERRRLPIDWLGAFCIAVSATTLLLVLSMAGRQFDWLSGWAVLLTALTIAALLAAIWIERRAADPVLPPRLFSNPTFVRVQVAGFFVSFAMFGAIIYLPQYLQVVREKSPTVSGLMMIPLVLTITIVSIISGKLITRWGRWKIWPVAGLFAVAVACGLLATMSEHTPLLLLCTFMAILGAGLGCTLQVLILAVQNATDQQDLGIATSATTFSRSMGSAVGVALFGAVLVDRMREVVPARLAEYEIALAPDRLSGYLGTPGEIGGLAEPLRSVLREGFTLGMDRIFLLAVPFALIAFVAVFLVKELPLRR